MGKIRYLKRLLGEVFAFARQRKAYWLVPMILLLLLIAALVMVSQATAPFIYTLF